MKVYIAGRYERREGLKRLGESLAARGHTITSRWLGGGHEHAAAELCANEDIADIEAADALVSITEPSTAAWYRGGRHVEFGYALARGKRVFVVGYKENIFHHLPEVRFLPLAEDYSFDVDALDAALREAGEPTNPVLFAPITELAVDPAPAPVSGTDRRRSALQQVEGCVCKDRQNSYGDAEDNFASIATIINAYLGDRVKSPITALDVAAFMLATKLARAKTSPHHLDNWIDAAGYAVCGAGIVMAKQS